MSIFCKTCGASNEDDALFCSSCGNAFEQKKPDPAPAEPVIPTASEPVSAPVSEPAANAPVNEAPPASAEPNPAQNQGFNAPPQGAPYNNQTPPPPPPYMGGYNAFGGTPNNGNVSFGEAISLYFKNYANFKGRASKSEFWYSYLFTLIIGMVLGFIGSFCSTFVIELTNASFEEQSVINLVFNSLSNLFSIATFIPSLAVAVRRLHDTGKSGGYYFISLIPIVGIIIGLVGSLLGLYCLAGIVIAVLIFCAYKYTTGGYQLLVISKNPTAAKYAGISIKKNILTVFFPSAWILVL